jgi:hypothetical protein
LGISYDSENAKNKGVDIQTRLIPFSFILYNSIAVFLMKNYYLNSI